MGFSPGDPNAVFDLICETFGAERSILPFSRQLLLGVCERGRELDVLIRQASKNWRLDRMPLLDRSILRLATFEILFIDDIPPKVSIDEAVELGKRFGSEDSGSFINGVLDNIYNSLVAQGRLKKPAE